MEIKLYILLLLFLIFLFFLTSFNAFTLLTLNNLEKNIVCLYSDLPFRVNENEIFEIFLKCENCGSIGSYYYAEITIYNRDRVITRIISDKHTLEPSQYFEFSTNVSLPPGIYNVTIRCLSEEVYREHTKHIEVVSKPKPIPIRIPSPPIILQPKIYKVEFFYPKTINVSQGDVINFFVKVTNRGDTLTDVGLNVSSIFKTKVLYPRKVARLETNESITFALEINVSYDIEPGEYVLNFCLVSKEFSDCQKTRINVFKSTLLEKIEKLLEHYESIVQDLKREVFILENQNRNVSLILEYILAAERSLEYSKRLLSYKLLEDSLKELENTRKIIASLIFEITKVQLEKTQYRKVSRVYHAIDIELIFNFLIALSILFVIYLIAKKVYRYLEFRFMYSFKLRKLKL